VQGAQRHAHAAVAKEVRVGQGHGEQVVLVADRRGQEEGAGPFQFQHQAGQVAGALVVESFLAQAAGLDVAVVVEDGEGVAVLEDARAVVRRAGGGEDVVRPPVSARRLPVHHNAHPLFGVRRASPLWMFFR
jgi:hypothetical protein